MQQNAESTAQTAEIIPFPRQAPVDRPENVLLEHTIEAARAACLHLGSKMELVIADLERNVTKLSAALDGSPGAATAENLKKLSQIKGQLAVARYMIQTLHTDTIVKPPTDLR
ncbi:MAG TPA: hypothetical protein VEA77_03950 [Hyphomicrobium sp.]|nr:hypothetical protein [Hyphomicrobium sp.]